MGEALSGSESLVLPVARGSAPLVLKLQDRGPEAAHEADALRRWDGSGAVQLEAYDAERRALLIERCHPGTPLADAERTDPMDVILELLPRLTVDAGPGFTPLQAEARRWSATLPETWATAGKPCERALVDAAVDLLPELSAEDGSTLVNQDLHGHNILAAEREPWLAIDPKPLRGAPDFAPVPVIRSFEFGHSEKAVRYRLDRLSAELGLDRARVRGWTIGHTTAWGFGGAHDATHHQTVRWLIGI
ncbi:aminoglycoside phosphotransferase family protein [Pontivivens ytuae]|uniref:Aminoglycoside phosphotransferase n=1 Tax=Pontivivens ytuae TaxID=2789856 RepID=A0A7S9QC61_9RHOB|nr:aminoglycoside phosphotransferase family protein [Pontivivens ytuae]QPH53588.1 aminoglycoside phosphotransferase [Pontivivens ytuae]